MMMALATMATMCFAPTQNSSAASTHRFTSDTSMEAFRTSACDAAAFPLDLGDTQCHGLGKKAANIVEMAVVQRGVAQEAKEQAERTKS